MKMSLEEAIEVGLRFHHEGQLRQAEQIYKQVLAYDSRNADAMHLLGLLAHQAKEFKIAEEMISRALLVKPEAALFHYNLSEAYRMQGEFPKAFASLEKAIELEPEYTDAYNNLGLIQVELGKFELGEQACRKAIELDEEFSGAWNNLGNSLRCQERYAEAIEAYRKAISLRDEYAEAWSNMAICFNQLAQYDAGIEALKTAIRLKPEFADAHNNLGVSYMRKGRIADAQKSLRTAIQLKPRSADAKLNLGTTMRELGRLDEAIDLFKEAIADRPDFAEAYNNLAFAQKDIGDFNTAMENLEKALEMKPNFLDGLVTKAMILKEQKQRTKAVGYLEQVISAKPKHALALNCLGLIHLEQGNPQQAAEFFQRSLESSPDPQTHSNLLLTINYLPRFSPSEVAEQHFTWGRTIEYLFKGMQTELPQRTPAERRLRVGYISPDFNAHPVSYFIQSFLKHHNKDRFEVFAYAHIVRPDAMTLYLQSLIPNWRWINGLPPSQIRELIVRDQIDILVDLAGHTAFTALPVFATKAAPVQISMVGYPNTTGLSTVDYRITDGRCDPEGMTEKFSSEKLHRMEDIFWCYTPDESSETIEIKPHDYTQAPVRFCSMNNPAKVTDEAVNLWAQILKHVPHSTMVIQGGGLNEESTQKRILDIMELVGIDRARLQVMGSTSLIEYFQRMADCDIALDTFPFNGGTTTCHKLWMGLPVVALEGKSHVSRMGYSILNCVGLGELVAKTLEEYIKIAVDLAGNTERLSNLRLGLRERLLTSPLLDEEGYTRNLEAAYETFWSTRKNG